MLCCTIVSFSVTPLLLPVFLKEQPALMVATRVPEIATDSTKKTDMFAPDKGAIFYTPNLLMICVVLAFSTFGFQPQEGQLRSVHITPSLNVHTFWALL